MACRRCSWEGRPASSTAQAQVSKDVDFILLASANEFDGLREALDAEIRAEQALDRAYWAPLKAEMESFRRAEREAS